MNYDLSVKEERASFIKRANLLLRKQKSNVALKDESNRTLNQNSYIHVLCRIMASQTGVTEAYAKQVYFKELANSELFVTTTKDDMTGKIVTYHRSMSDLTVPEMRKAITRFREWSSENGYYLPEATVSDDGTLSFATEYDKAAYHQALIQTSKVEQYL